MLLARHAARVAAALFCFSCLAALTACDDRPAPPEPAAPPERAAPRECAGQPCCGDPPRPCGDVIEDAIDKPCKTACDCRPGLACHQGRCASGTVAVFCCEACPATVPADQVCQERNGSTGKCGAPAPAR